MSRLILSTKTACTHVDPFLLAINSDGDPMNVWQPASLDMLLGMAYAIPELNSFTTNITLHNKPLPLYYKGDVDYYITNSILDKGRKDEN